MIWKIVAGWLAASATFTAAWAAIGARLERRHEPDDDPEWEALVAELTWGDTYNKADR